MRYKELEIHVLDVLLPQLDEGLCYHNIQHTKNVIHHAETIGIGESFDSYGLKLLKTSALLHDIGYLKQYRKNEEVAATMAKDLLPNYGYKSSDIELISNAILTTSITTTPFSPLEKALCDADLDYLGRTDYFEIFELLLKEFRQNGRTYTEKEAFELQIGFFKTHMYFTNTQQQRRNEQKQKNLIQIEEAFCLIKE